MCIFRLLNADEIEVKVKQVTEKGAVALLYKTARTDMDLLDEQFGAGDWECDYKEIKGNLYCGIGVKQADGTTIWKWDCGIESREDGEGNEKKGEASDAFKRAGTKWGIGRELYTAPFISLKVETEANSGKAYKLKDKYQTFDVAEIGYDDNRRINRLVIKDSKGQTVFTYGIKASKITTYNDYPTLPSEATSAHSQPSSGCVEWDEAMLEFIAEGGNPEAFAKYCHKERAEQLTVEELRYGTSLKREAKKAAV